MHRDRLDHDHGGSAERPFAIVGEVAFAGQAVDRHVRGMRPNVMRLASVQWRSGRE